MCENQNMEKKQEEMKVIHSQHTRILKEDDEIWISSEDLNTENSSDDDRSKTKHAFKKKLKLKDRKRSSPNIKLQRPSIPSVPCTSKELDNRLLMPTVDDPHSRSTDESRTSDEECHIPPISTECLTKRMSLEDWRPMKGALNISALDETASSAGDVRKIVNETGNFYNSMLYKLKSLKSCSVLQSAREEKSKEQEKLPAVGKTFKYLKDTPGVKKKLHFIKKLDEEINETISRYKVERDDRLSTEFKMCKDIREQNLAEDRDTEMFLQMCNFQERLTKSREGPGKSGPGVTEQSNNTESANEADNSEYSGENEEEAIKITDRENLNDFAERTNNDCTRSINFISKNVQAAKEGLMATFSLTDEEKAKVAELLKDIDDFQLNDADLTLSSPSLTESGEPCNKETFENGRDDDVNNHLNAFSVSEKDKTRIGEIDSELKKFMESEESNGSIKKDIPVVKDEEFWKKYVLDQSLKEIDAKLERLYASYIEDEEKLKRSASSEELGEEETEIQLGIKAEN